MAAVFAASEVSSRGLAACSVASDAVRPPHVLTDDSFFEQCFPNAPFLDPAYDSIAQQVRERSLALFLSIVAVGARYWSRDAKYEDTAHRKCGS